MQLREQHEAMLRRQQESRPDMIELPVAGNLGNRSNGFGLSFFGCGSDKRQDPARSDHVVEELDDGTQSTSRPHRATYARPVASHK